MFLNNSQNLKDSVVSKESSVTLDTAVKVHWPFFGNGKKKIYIVN